MRRWGVALALAAAVVIAVLLIAGGKHPTRPPAPGPPARAPAPSLVFGASVNLLFNTGAFTPAQIDLQLAALHATGATIARSDALWERTEPQAPVSGRHSYDWSFDDGIAGALARAGLRWLPILDYSAGWARADPELLHSPPSDPQQFAGWAAAFARRYGPGGVFWAAKPTLEPEPVDTYEVWNEPDSGLFWQPLADAAAYARLYAATRAAIAAVQPDARVIVGGLTNPAAFLPALLGADPGLRAHIDGVAVHPYGPPAVVIAKVRADRATLAGLGLATLPLYVTEVGWTTSPPGALNYVPATRRPGYIEQALTELGGSGCGIAAVVLYTWVTPQLDPTNPEDWYGIHPPAGTGPSPDTAAFSVALRNEAQAQRLASPRLRRQCSSASEPRVNAASAGLTTTRR